MGKNKKTIINLTCSVMVLITNILVGFFLSPYIVSNIGVEANGFVTLANNFVSYAQLIVTALNSMATRFITIPYVKKDYKTANLYYNSVFWGNLIIVAVLIVPATYFIAKMDNIIDIPSDIVFDVKLLFAFVFFNFFLPTAFPNWDCGTYITNRLDRTYIPQMFTALLRCVCLYVLLKFLKPHVWYVGMVYSIVAVITLAVAGFNTHNLTPELKIRLKPHKRICSKKAIKDLVGAGIWNSISSAGITLLNGLDLIICNIFISSTAMGVLSLAKILSNYMEQFSQSITRVFAPELLIYYAKGDTNQLLKDINRACKITTVFLIVPLSGIIVMSEDFFRLWVPSQDAKLLSQLAIVTCIGYAFTSGIQVLYLVFSITNKVRTNAIIILISGVVSTAIVFVLLKTTNLGIYAVAGVSVMVCLVKNMLYTIPYAGIYLGLKKTQFYPQVIFSIVLTLVTSVIGYVIRRLFVIDNWGSFLICAAVIAIVGYAVNILVFLNKEEKRKILSMIKKRKDSL
jgi:O-antigen/teichoic acid export membrane protein